MAESATWEEFCDLIKARLQLTSVRAIYHASTMTPLASTRDLRDIEDLVVDGEEAAPANGAASSGAGASRTGLAPAVSAHLPAPPGIPPKPGDIRRGSETGGGGEDGEDKYKKRAPLLRQLAQTFAPSLASAIGGGAKQQHGGAGGSKGDDGLDAMEGGGRRGRGGAGRGEAVGTPTRTGGARAHRRTDPRVVVVALSLLSCLASMVLLYNRIAAKLPPP